MKFSNKQELLAQLKKQKACDEGYEWAEKQKDLKTILKNCPSNYRAWVLRRGYEQFAEFCDWSKFTVYEWVKLLEEEPQYSVNFHNWSSLEEFNWASLLEKQPQFAVFCDFLKFNKSLLVCFLKENPEAKKYVYCCFKQ